MSIVTRQTLRNSIRQDLASWPIQAPLDTAIDNKTTTITLPDDSILNFLEQKMLIEIGGEIMKVIDIPKPGSSIRVIRGYMNTTPAAAVKDTVANIYPSYGWTDAELNRLLNQAIRWLKPFAWKDAVSAAFTWSNGTTQTNAPTGISYPDGNQIYRLEVLDTDGNYKLFLGWMLLGSVIRFNRKSASDHTLQARIIQFQSILTDDTTTLDNDQFEEAITKYTAHLAINALKTNRVRYHDYAAALNDRASTPDELVRVAFDLKNQAIVSREENAYPRPAGFGKTYREITS